MSQNNRGANQKGTVQTEIKANQETKRTSKASSRHIDLNAQVQMIKTQLTL